MKGLLKFDLDEPHERLAFRRAVNADDAYLALLEIQNYLRTEIKYREHSDSVYDKLEEVREKVYTIINNQVNMDDLE